MSLAKIGLSVLVLILIAIQFVQPARNQSGQVLPTDISRIYPVPERIEAILKKSCYDCHSNNTRYPWYASLQPASWWMAYHIKRGKADLNFGELGNYSRRRQQNKLRAIENSLKDQTMPLPAYILMHKNAQLSLADKKLLLDWVKEIKDSLSRIN